MKLATYNQKGEKTGETVIPKEISNVGWNEDFLHQVIVSQRANQRQKSAHTKNRGEVRGGGRKPWRQKGTGRARHGSIRSPLWRGGGVAHGPRVEKFFKREIPKKMKRKALLMALLKKIQDKEVFLVEDFELKEPKTKEAANFLKKILPELGKKVLLILPKYDKNIFLAFRNIEETEVKEAKDLNALDLLSKKYLIILKDALKIIKEVFVVS